EQQTLQVARQEPIQARFVPRLTFHHRHFEGSRFRDEILPCMRDHPFPLPPRFYPALSRFGSYRIRFFANSTQHGGASSPTATTCRTVAGSKPGVTCRR